MRSLPLVLRVYGERQGDQWSVICLDFNLAAQACTIDEAKARLHEQIRSYLRDALEGGVDESHGEYFLTRRAPAVFWVKYYVARACKALFSPAAQRLGPDRSRLVARDSIPLQVSVA